ncbi:rCG30754 [Rattus norvegicus]|uniref:RCG30754 n=1 Tax=Rattus norvegicus TaxID=10116 RepID=A6ISP9_RAT|nr:rCG30754 [Rattus norvegicus]
MAKTYIRKGGRVRWIKIKIPRPGPS